MSYVEKGHARDRGRDGDCCLIAFSTEALSVTKPYPCTQGQSVNRVDSHCRQASTHPGCVVDHIL